MYSYMNWGVAQRDFEGKSTKTQRVLTEKGDEARSRLRAQEFAKGDAMEGLFAVGPPLFAEFTLVSRSASDSEQVLALMVIGVSCALLYAPANRTLYIELPLDEEQGSGGRKWTSWKKSVAWYKGRTPQAWLEELSCTLAALGFRASRMLPGVYWNGEFEVGMVEHVDDLLCSGREDRLQKVKKRLSQNHEVKRTIMNGGGGSVLGPHHQEELRGVLRGGGRYAKGVVCMCV